MSEPARAHALCLPIDPKGTPGRRFRCDDCGDSGRLGDLMARPCADPILSTEEALEKALGLDGAP